jgi:hypothetical protein
MGMPSISISFTEVAATAVKRGERGIIAMILKDENVPETNPAVCVSNADIPETIGAENQEQIKLALMGYINTPLRVIAYVIPDDAENYNDALNGLKTEKFDYLVCPTVETDECKDDIISYVKTERKDNKLIKAVLPNAKGDYEGIINYTTETVYVDGKEYSAQQYCSRIAGIIAGTPLTIACTYAPLSELTDCTRLTKEERDKAVDAGEMIIWWDGEKCKTGRGVNSLVTLTQEKNTQFQKIKIVDAMDMIANDIRTTAEDNYIGKYANSYDNKCLLISAIGNYFSQLVSDGVIEDYEIGIDIEANRSYLKGRGEDVDSMSDDEIKTANTGSYVYLTCKLSMLDAIEDIILPISI